MRRRCLELEVSYSLSTQLNSQVLAIDVVPALLSAISDQRFASVDHPFSVVMALTSCVWSHSHTDKDVAFTVGFGLPFAGDVGTGPLGGSVGYIIVGSC